jgi:hypothetical protein
MVSGGLVPSLFDDDPDSFGCSKDCALGSVVVFDRRTGLSDPIVDWDRPSSTSGPTTSPPLSTRRGARPWCSWDGCRHRVAVRGGAPTAVRSCCTSR